jgi:uncharacterized phiE125 gp8 family phage protein
MNWGLVQTEAPASEPITIEEARAWLRVDDTAQDALIAALVAAARRMVERRTNRALLASAWQMTIDRFPCGDARRAILLPLGPVIAISAITYLDTGGVERTMAPADYRYDLSREPAPITTEWGKSWPSARDVIGAIAVDFSAGYADAAAVPQDLKLAMQLLVGHWFENRESVVVGAVSNALQLAFDDLLEPYRIWSFT